ncbi:hypothetical protein NEF87_000286 [Candidatus Lokiarchaeum ossiferum]|uniref:Uncharacterized protein n=1 Tax=Candidatus Lokiarchaeum ossiferum TaxID=2951803 RepID=A0ABY6HKR4_9ARCH|nr:hypothetical protein NEF87_000286 [Candidatus Lokiarchaeum sp. B-35]
MDPLVIVKGIWSLHCINFVNRSALFVFILKAKSSSEISGWFNIILLNNDNSGFDSNFVESLFDLSCFSLCAWSWLNELKLKV